MNNHDDHEKICVSCGVHYYSVNGKRWKCFDCLDKEEYHIIYDELQAIVNKYIGKDANKVFPKIQKEIRKYIKSKCIKKFDVIQDEYQQPKIIKIK